MKSLLAALILLFCLTVPCPGQTDSRGSGHEIFGIVTHPYTGVSISRFNTIQDWSTSFEMGVEVDFSQGWYGGVEIVLHDILTDIDSEIVPWDQTFKIGFGKYW